MDKPSSLLGLIISDKGKKFYNIDTRSEFHKTFKLVIYSRCKTSYFSATVIYEREKFMKLSTEVWILLSGPLQSANHRLRQWADSCSSAFQS